MKTKINPTLYRGHGPARVVIPKAKHLVNMKPPRIQDGDALHKAIFSDGRFVNLYKAVYNVYFKGFGTRTVDGAYCNFETRKQFWMAGFRPKFGEREPKLSIDLVDRATLWKIAMWTQGSKYMLDPRFEHYQLRPIWNDQKKKIIPQWSKAEEEAKRMEAEWMGPVATTEEDDEVQIVKVVAAVTPSPKKRKTEEDDDDDRKMSPREMKKVKEMLKWFAKTKKKEDSDEDSSDSSDSSDSDEDSSNQEKDEKQAELKQITI